MTLYCVLIFWLTYVEYTILDVKLTDNLIVYHMHTGMKTNIKIKTFAVKTWDKNHF
jgi:hypothetical protein